MHEENSNTNAVEIYTGVSKTEKLQLHFALIHGLYEEDVFVPVWQIQWKHTQLFVKQKDILLSDFNLAWDIKTVNANKLLLFYEKTNCWVEKEIMPILNYRVDYYPRYILPHQMEGQFDANPMLQIWGTCFYSTRLSGGNLLGSLTLSLVKNKTKEYTFDYPVEWWSKDL